MRNMSKFLVIVLTASLFALPLSANAWDDQRSQSSEYFEPEQPGAGMMMWDLIAVRPFSIAASVVGSAFFIVEVNSKNGLSFRLVISVRTRLFLEA